MSSRIIIATMACICFIIIVALLIRPESTPSAPQDEFTLHKHETKNTEDPLIAAGNQWFFQEYLRSESLKGLPKELSTRASFYTIKLGGRPTRLALTESKKPKLYVDTDGDGDLSNEQVISGTRKRHGFWFFASSVYSFGPVDLTIKGTDKNETVRLMFKCQDGEYLEVYPASYHAGKIRIGQETYRVAVMDGNFDGRYTSGWSTSRSWERERAYDYLAIDFNRNGQFDHDYSHYGKTEIRPLTNTIRIENTYYDIKVAKDCSAIKINKAAPMMGTLDLDCPDAELVLFSAYGLEHLKSTNGKWELPVGEYTCWMASLSHTDQNNDKWTLEGSRETGKLEQFKIKAGKTLTLKMGPPLKVKTDQQRGFSFFGKSISIGVTIIGQAGEEYTAGAMKNGRNQSTPKLKIIDSNGKVLAEGQFEYG